MHTLSSPTALKSENLQFIKFIAALAVILSHSFSINGNVYGKEFFNRYTDGALALGDISVSVFFICGGYLISASLNKNNGFCRFFKARIIRLVPPLAFVVVICTVLGCFFSTLTLPEYYSDMGTYKYLLNIVFVPVHSLPGVFKTNPKTAVNGSLWTLPVEFADYICVFILFKLGLADKKKFIFTLPFPIAAIIIERYLPGVLAAAVRPTVLFYIGAAFFVYRDKIKLSFMTASVLLLIFALLIYFKLPDIAVYFCLPYVILYISFGLKQLPKAVGNLGNISYSMYLWGFPVQQSFLHFFGICDPYFSFCICAVITIALAYVTYLICEKGIVKFRQKRNL